MIFNPELERCSIIGNENRFGLEPSLLITKQNQLIEQDEIKLVGFSAFVSLNQDLADGVVAGLRE